MPMLTGGLYVAWQMLDVVVFVYLRMTPRPSARMNTARVSKDTLYWVWIEVNSNALTTKPSRGWIAPRNKISSQIAGRMAMAAIPAGLFSPPNTCWVVVSIWWAMPGVQAWLNVSTPWANAKKIPAAARASVICHHIGLT